MSRKSLIEKKNSIVSYSIVRDILFMAINEIENLNLKQHFNERYLHHYFSREIQKYLPIEFSGETKFHPEWATYRQGNNSKGAKYKKHSDGYKIDDRFGSSGFVDFAIGDVEKPYLAIEFKMSNSFDKKGVFYDYIKLLDNKNPFRIAVSFVVYYGLKTKSRAITLDNLNRIFEAAICELKEDRLDIERDFHFYVVEVNNSKCLVYERSSFEVGFQLIADHIH